MSNDLNKKSDKSLNFFANANNFYYLETLIYKMDIKIIPLKKIEKVLYLFDISKTKVVYL